MAISQNFTDAEGFLWDIGSATPNTGTGLSVLDGTSDAFDAAFQLIVDGNAVNPQTASVDAGGRELNTVPFLSGNIAVGRSILVSDASISPVGFARFLDSFTNTGSTTHTVTVVLTSNLGSDSATAVQATTSGDTVLTNADFGFASDDGNLSGGDPGLGFAYGDGVGLLPSPAALNDGVFFLHYSITLEPGETARLLHYAVQNTTAAASVADYTKFTRNLDLLRTDNFLAGLSETEISQVVNYSYGTGPLPPVVLTDGDGNRWGLDQNKLGLRTLDTDVLLNADGGDVVEQNFTVVGPVTMAEDGQEANYRATFNGFPEVSATYSVMASPTQGYARALLLIDPGLHPLDLDGNVGTGLNVKLGGAPQLIADRPLAGGAGDGAVSILDSGVVVDDSASGAGGTRPALTVVFGDTAALDADPDGEANTLSGNILRATDTGIFIAPGTTASFLYFFALNDDGLGGLLDLNRLSNPGYEALAGLSAAEVASIRNFSLDETDRLQTTNGDAGDNAIQGHFWGDSLNGLAGDDQLFGYGSDDRLLGSVGNDLLDGGIGDDVMIGGAGNDSYYVDAAGDIVAEAAGGGSDTVYASVSYALQANQEVEYLRANAGATGLTLTGNNRANQLVSGAGNDALVGLGSNDSYYVNNFGDLVTEAAGGGSDTVFAGVSYALQANQEIEYLRANAGATGLTLTGNDLVNRLFSGAGNDTLVGLGGNDIYYVNNAGDIVTEAAGGGGADNVYASVSYTLQANQEIEYLRADAGATGVTLTGNELVNRLLSGAGNDTLAGLGGNDSYYVNNAGDIVNEAAGGGGDTVFASVGYTLKNNQEIEVLRANAGVTGLTLTGNNLANQLIGNTGNDTLSGAGGIDKFTGGAGSDKFVFNATSASLVATPDSIFDFGAGDRIDVHLIDADGIAANGDSAFVLDALGDNSFANGHIKQTLSGTSLFLDFNTDADAASEMRVALLNHGTAIDNGGLIG